MVRVAFYGVGILAVACLISLGQEPPSAETTAQTKPPIAWYDGFPDDQKLLRKHFVHKGRDGAKDARASSAEACQAAHRIFAGVPFLFKTREEVLQILGDPATISDYNRPLSKEPGSPLVYVFDSGFGGMRYTLSLSRHDRFRVTKIEAEGQN